ncbi:unnamed protein product [Choristocarpus tenellus]
MAVVGGREDSDSEPVKVIVRVRPELDRHASRPVVVAQDDKTVALLPPPLPPPDPTGKSKPQAETKATTMYPNLLVSIIASTYSGCLHAVNKVTLLKAATRKDMPLW